MATTEKLDNFFLSILQRRSIYKLQNSCPIPDDKIHEVVSFAIKNAPSAFNVQSARAVILLKVEHEKLWDIGNAVLKKSVPEAAYNALAPRVAGFKEGYGTVLWFEDEEALETSRRNNPAIKHVITEWSDHSSGMHQVIVWTALELQGLGCNLQHYNFNPEFTQQVLDTWNLPKAWKLKAQLVFGTPAGPPRERTYLPLEERVKMISST